ncbi:MAG: hypothetical protein CVT61_00185 [Actinobacteria bacterium HGW-Actinobacteria-11]|nr:MAG: hypothetical protein CVT61_00185 [Actinobacteria bacterium HGW-Actinobacteria-11]
MTEIGSSYKLPDDAHRVTAGAPWALARERFEVWLPAYDLDLPHDAHLSVVWAPDREHYVVSTFEAIGTHLEPVTPESLRAMPLARLLAQACRSVPQAIVDVDGEDLLMLPSIPNRIGGLAAKGPTPEVLDIVARLYVGASAIRWKPAQHVADVLGLAPRTATHWIKLARERGHFGERNG